MNGPVEDLRAAMCQQGIAWAGDILGDGKIHRFTPEGDKEDNGWYVLYGSAQPVAGAFGCWKRQINEDWCYRNGDSAPLAGRDLAQARIRWAQARAEREKEDVARQERGCIKASDFISKCGAVQITHPYLNSKKVPVFGAARISLSGEIVLPLVDSSGKLWSYQTIDSYGGKLFMPGGRVRGCFFKIPGQGPQVICEGYATGASIHEATGWPVACAMNCGNLKDVATELRKLNPGVMILAADNDRFNLDNEGKPVNPGLSKAREAAIAVKAQIALPEFSPSDTGTDFNDLAALKGSGVLRRTFEACVGIGMGTRIEISTLLDFDSDADSSTVIGKRFLCRGGSCVIVGQTSAGKSSFGLQMAICFAIGIPFFGVKPIRPLKSLFVQAENDEGDMAEMLQGILAGMELVSPETPKENVHIAHLLSKNLIIIRDQTHVGIKAFPDFATKLAEIHRPDMFWIDPLLSFYGNDINNQEQTSLFLRGCLNPLSEKSGHIWMLLHHTGKPNREAQKSMKKWNSRDFAYMGIGSSELSNWARAIITINSTSEDEFRVVFAKRGWRAGICDESGNPASELYLAHASNHICWKQIPKPVDEKTEDGLGVFAKSLSGQELSATEIVRLAEKELKRGVRTIWSLWGSGEGQLGKLFRRSGDRKYIYSLSENTLPYKD